MANPKPTPRNKPAIDAALIDSLKSDFHGQVIMPGEADYDAARRIWNASIDKHPGAIARCSGAADVVNAVKFARATDLLVSVRGGGHNVAGRALCDDGIVIDLSAMRGRCRRSAVTNCPGPGGRDAGRRRYRDAGLWAGGPDRYGVEDRPS